MNSKDGLKDIALKERPDSEKEDEINEDEGQEEKEEEINQEHVGWLGLSTFAIRDELWTCGKLYFQTGSTKTTIMANMTKTQGLISLLFFH